MAECQKLINAKGDSISIFSGVDEAHLQSHLKKCDSVLKDLAIDLLKSIPYIEEEFEILPNLSNYKPIGDITIFQPMNAVELAELVQDMKDKADGSNGTQGFS